MFAAQVVVFADIMYSRCDSGPWKPRTTIACAMFSLLQQQHLGQQVTRGYSLLQPYGVCPHIVTSAAAPVAVVASGRLCKGTAERLVRPVFILNSLQNT